MNSENELRAGSKKTGIIWLVIVTVFFIVSILLIGKVINLNSQLEQFQEAQNSLIMRVDSLRALTQATVRSEGDFPTLLTSYDITQMRRRGLDDPVQAIRDDLQNSSHLIEQEAVLGGTMQFYEDQIYVLTNQWVLAYFDDGHIAGYMWLEYSVNGEGDIAWQVKDSYLL